MNTEILKYKVIKDKEQSLDYCNQLEDLSTQENTDVVQDEIELLTIFN